MTATQRLRHRLVDSPNSVAERFRAERWAALERTFPDIKDMHVIDLGGTVSSWARAPIRPERVTVLTFEPESEHHLDWVEARFADACDLPDWAEHLRGDLVYSNAVLEHVGGAERRRRFADSVHRLAEFHWVQTPYRYFPVEPHWLFPGFQFLPVAARVSIGRRWRLVHTPNPDYDAMMASVLSVDLVGRAELRHIFPSSRVECERFAGLIKSIIAVRS